MNMEIDDIVFTDTIELNPSYFESYLGVKDGCTLRADVLTAPLDTDAKKAAFHDYCAFLKKRPYMPGFQPLYKGLIRESDRRGVLIWHHTPDLLLLKDALKLLKDRDSKTRFLSCVASRLFSYHYDSTSNTANDSDEESFEDTDEEVVYSSVGPSLESMFIDKDLLFPVFTCYGIQPLLVAVFGDEGSLCPLHALPEFNDCQLQMFELVQKIDKYMFGVLMYEIIDETILSRDKKILEQVTTKCDRGEIRLVFHNNDVSIFLQRIAENLVTVDAIDDQFQLEGLKLSFISILQEDITSQRMVEYCRKAHRNGENPGDDALMDPEERNFMDLRCIEPRNYETGKPICTSMIIGRKVVHDKETFHAFLNSLPNRHVIFILIIGQYQIGKTTFLSLITGNKHYIIGTDDGSSETTRGVSLVGPISLNDLDETFRNLTGVREDIMAMYKMQKVFRDEKLKEMNPDVVFVDIEGFGGQVNGSDTNANDQVFRELVDPYIAICNNLLFMVDVNVTLTTLDFVIDTLALVRSVDQQFKNTFAISIIFRNVRSVMNYRVDRSLPFNNPFDRNLQGIAKYMLERKMDRILKKKLKELKESSGVQDDDNVRTALHFDRCRVSTYPLAVFSNGVQLCGGSERSEVFDLSVVAVMGDLITTVHTLNSENNRILDCGTVLGVFDRVADRSLPSLEAFRLHQEEVITNICDNILKQVLNLLDEDLKDKDADYLLDESNNKSLKKKWTDIAIQMFTCEISREMVRDDFNAVAKMCSNIESDIARRILTVLAQMLDFNRCIQDLTGEIDDIKAEISQDLAPTWADTERVTERQWVYWCDNHTRDFVGNLDFSEVNLVINKAMKHRKLQMEQTLNNFKAQWRKEIKDLFTLADDTLKVYCETEDMPEEPVEYEGIFEVRKHIWKRYIYKHPSGKVSNEEIQIWENSSVTERFPILREILDWIPNLIRSIVKT